MSQLILFNKPYQVLCQFSPHENKSTLKDYIPIKGIYPAGRLDYDSEGLLLLTDDGKLQHRLSDPRYNKEKVYWAQVEGLPTAQDLQPFYQGIELKDGLTKPARAIQIDEPEGLWPRCPPIRVRQHIPDCWLEITLSEGKNRQVRRMCAALGFPVLRLIRARIDNYSLGDLQPGDYMEVSPAKQAK